MRLLWLKVHASFVDDEPTTAIRRIDSRSDRDLGAANDGEGDAEAVAPSERSWNVKSVPRSVAPWTGVDAPPAGAEPPNGEHSN